MPVASASQRRAERLARVPSTVDLLVIGGGITGAGIALEAARRGVQVLLVEAQDFAFGSSSRSSKLVHGGLRYLKDGKPGLTLESVRERNQLLRDVPGLVDPLGFVMAHHAGRKPSRLSMRLGLALYDLFAGARCRDHVDASALALIAPGIDPVGLAGASLYLDASTDDARLVLRVLAEAQAYGAQVLNYLEARALLRDEQGLVVGAALFDTACEPPDPLRTALHVRARCTIAATGAWSDRLRGTLGKPAKLRPLRGSHLLLPAWRLPLARAVAFMHPGDGRPVFAYPWQGVTLVGTTDVDHSDVEHEPAISADELSYLLDALNREFPGLGATPDDVLSTWAGVRPVVHSGKHLAPSQESRDHLVLEEYGLISVIGGKLTTFRRIAQDTLRRAAARLPMLLPTSEQAIIPRHPEPADLAQRLPHLSRAQRQRLCAHHGAQLRALLDAATPDELHMIDATPTLLAELRWAARSEQVVHLDDLLLRRTRLGLLLRRGGAAWLPEWREPLCTELGWDASRWQAECARYLALIQRCYALPQASV